MIRDNFGNCFRRNWRLITRTENINFNASDLLYEQNVGGGDGGNLPLNDIAPP